MTNGSASPAQYLTYHLQNIYASGQTSSQRSQEEQNDEAYCLLYRNKNGENVDKNDSLIILSNTSNEEITLSTNYELQINWKNVLQKKELEEAISFQAVTMNGQNVDNWNVEFVDKEKERGGRYWELKPTKEVALPPKSKLEFKFTNIQVIDQEKDEPSLQFKWKGSANETMILVDTKVFIYNFQQGSLDSLALPINFRFVSPQKDKTWNVKQNELKLLHPIKRNDEVFSNTLNKSTIKSRLAFEIYNPSNVPLEKKPNADPRFVVAITYGDGVRALSKLEKEDEIFSLKLSGGGDFVEIPPHAIEVPPYSNSTKAITVAIWAKSDTSTWNSDGCLISKRDCFILHPFAGGTRIGFFIFSNGSWRSAEYAPPDIDITEWHHYAGTYDRTHLRLYIDGKEVRQVPWSSSIENQPTSLYIGSDSPDMNRYFQGQLALAAIWNRACSAAEIQSMITGSFTGQEFGLVGYYPLDQIHTHGSTKEVLDLSHSKHHGLVRGNPTIVDVSTSRTGQSRATQGIDLEIDVDIPPYHGTISDSSGVKTWTFRPRQDTVLDARQGLQLVFDNLDPDNTVGYAHIKVAYYDIQGYQDGFGVFYAQKNEPIPFFIEPTKPLKIEVANPMNPICLSWKAFGVDSFKLFARTSDNQLIELGSSLPSVAVSYLLTNLKDDPSVRDDLTLYLIPEGEDVTQIMVLAKLSYKGALGRKWWNSVHYSEWVKCEFPPFEYMYMYEIHQSEGSKVAVDYDVRLKRDPQPKIYSRLSLVYRRDHNNWQLELEVIDPLWKAPKPTSPFEFRGGGFFPLQNVKFQENGSVEFLIKGMEAVSINSSAAEVISTGDISGRIDDIDGYPVVSYEFIKAITNPEKGEEFVTYYPYGPIGGDGKVRPPLFNFNFGNRFFPTREAAEIASRRVYGVSDVKTEGGSTLQFLKSTINSQPTFSSHSRSIVSQDFHDQSLRNHDLSQAALDQVVFDGADLQGANFENSSLVQASLTNANLVLAKCSNANLQGAKLMGACLNYGQFLGANFNGANLTGANLIGANLSSANLMDAYLANTNFDTALVNEARFSFNSGLSDAQTQELIQRGAVFVERPEEVSSTELAVSRNPLADPSGSGAELMQRLAALEHRLRLLEGQGTSEESSRSLPVVEPAREAPDSGSFHESSSPEVSDNGPEPMGREQPPQTTPPAEAMPPSSPPVSPTGQADPGSGSGAETPAPPSLRNLQGAILQGAELSHKDLSYTDFSDADLRGADLSHTNLSNARLTGANLTGANLTGANLIGADLTGANLTDTILGDTTVAGEPSGPAREPANEGHPPQKPQEIQMSEVDLSQGGTTPPQPVESTPTLAETSLYKPTVRPQYF